MSSFCLTWGSHEEKEDLGNLAKAAFSIILRDELAKDTHQQMASRNKRLTLIAQSMCTGSPSDRVAAHAPSCDYR